MDELIYKLRVTAYSICSIYVIRKLTNDRNALNNFPKNEDMKGINDTATTSIPSMIIIYAAGIKLDW